MDTVINLRTLRKYAFVPELNENHGSFDIQHIYNMWLNMVFELTAILLTICKKLIIPLCLQIVIYIHWLLPDLDMQIEQNGARWPRSYIWSYGLKRFKLWMERFNNFEIYLAGVSAVDQLGNFLALLQSILTHRLRRSNMCSVSRMNKTREMMIAKSNTPETAFGPSWDSVSSKSMYNRNLAANGLARDNHSSSLATVRSCGIERRRPKKEEQMR